MEKTLIRILSLLLLYGIYTETGIITTITIGIIMLIREIKVHLTQIPELKGWSKPRKSTL